MTHTDETMEATIEMLKGKARDSWSGEEGERRAQRIEQFLRERLAHYAATLGTTEPEILAAWEKRRDYSAINYYQDSKFPVLSGVRLFKNLEEFKALIPSKTFRCPACKGASNSPYECDTGLPMSCGKKCDWKSYGLFGTMGTGLRFTFTDSFLENGGKIDEIFMPIDLEEKSVAALMKEGA